MRILPGPSPVINLFPRARIKTLVIWFMFIQVVRIPAVVMLGYWIFFRPIRPVIPFGILSEGYRKESEAVIFEKDGEGRCGEKKNDININNHTERVENGIEYETEKKIFPWSVITDVFPYCHNSRSFGGMA